MHSIRKLSFLCALLYSVTFLSSLYAAQWDGPAADLAHKIRIRNSSSSEAVLLVSNSSSLLDSEVTAITHALESALHLQGIASGDKNQPTIRIHVTLSENTRGYLWIAEIQNDSSREVVMLPVPRPDIDLVTESTPVVTLRRTHLIDSEAPILDVLTFDQPDQPRRLLILHPDAVEVYVMATDSPARISSAPTAPTPHSHPWPRDTRGRLVRTSENQFNAFLPGVTCSGSIENGLSLECKDSDAPWPISGDQAEHFTAEFVLDRNYFDGRVKFADEEFSLPAFFSAVSVPSTGPVFAVAGLDGRTTLLSKQPPAIKNWRGWGSEIARIGSQCGSGTQYLVTAGDALSDADALRAYEISDNSPVTASAPLRFANPITALWPNANGGAVAVSHNFKLDRYEASIVTVSCAQ